MLCGLAVLKVIFIWESISMNDTLSQVPRGGNMEGSGWTISYFTYQHMNGCRNKRSFPIDESVVLCYRESGRF